VQIQKAWVGELVQPTRGQPYDAITQIDPMRCRVKIPERDAQKVLWPLNAPAHVRVTVRIDGNTVVDDCVCRQGGRTVRRKPEGEKRIETHGVGFTFGSRDNGGLSNGTVDTRSMAVVIAARRAASGSERVVRLPDRARRGCVFPPSQSPSTLSEPAIGR